MICDSSVTIWHNGIAYYYDKVSLNHKIAIDKNGIKQTGYFNSSSCVLRIPTEKTIDISIGDYVRIGKHTGNHNRNTDFAVMEIKENFRGSTPHYKVVCKK